jgi:hypothetical protein
MMSLATLSNRLGATSEETANLTARLAVSNETKGLELEKLVYGTIVNRETAVNTTNLQTTEVIAASREQQEKTSSVFETMQKYLQEVLSSSPDQANEQKKPDQAMLTELKKVSELLIEQNKLAEEAMQYRRSLVDYAESQVRSTDRLIAATE